MTSAQTPQHKPSQDQLAALAGAFRAGRHDESLEMARALARQFPTSLAAWNIRGASARALGHLDEAETCFRQLETLDPAFAGAPYNLGLTLDSLGRWNEAIAAYQRAIAKDPELAQAHNNLGSALLRLGEVEAAVAHCEAAARLRPDLPEVHNTLGNALLRAGRKGAALVAYERARAINPTFAEAAYNIGMLRMELGETDQAIDSFRKVLAEQSGNQLARLQLAYLLAQECDWDAIEALPGDIPDLGVTTGAVPPWPMLALEDSPARQLARARSWARHNFRATPPPNPAPAAARPARRPLRLLYVSADFHDHPGARLLAGLLREHDRSRLEVHAFCIGPRYDDEYRRAAEDSIEHFHDVFGWSDERVLALARSLEFDIAIDRQGYTVDSRTSLFQYRLAPVQMVFLGYPGTMGTQFLDYLIADPTVVPEQHREHYSERLIRLPHCYMATDNQMRISDQPTTRADHGLPEQAVVLCCFNASYKITAREFDIWMRVLDRTGGASGQGSVLWLFKSNQQVRANLRQHAARRGVDPDRLIFAARLPNAEHLERHVLADLFVDTFCFNAHTTTVDALWAGLPVVTMEGRQFAARVASSLLRSVGLDELITQTPSEYEALITALVSDPARLAGIKAKLAVNRLTQPLFDTKRYSRYFEAGLEMAHDRFQSGLPPADIAVPE